VAIVCVVKDLESTCEEFTFRDFTGGRWNLQRREYRDANGDLHRAVGSAVQTWRPSGRVESVEYWKHGKLHRDDGSARFEWFDAPNAPYGQESLPDDSSAFSDEDDERELRLSSFIEEWDIYHSCRHGYHPEAHAVCEQCGHCDHCWECTEADNHCDECADLYDEAKLEYEVRVEEPDDMVGYGGYRALKTTEEWRDGRAHGTHSVWAVDRYDSFGTAIGCMEKQSTYRDGKLHCEWSPAYVEYLDSIYGDSIDFFYGEEPVLEEWFLDGSRHRENGPAVVQYPTPEDSSDGLPLYQAWWQFDAQHRLDGPAVVKYNWETESIDHWYYIKGIEFHEADFEIIRSLLENGAPLDWVLEHMKSQATETER
jgi:hypothetical protein